MWIYICCLLYVSAIEPGFVLAFAVVSTIESGSILSSNAIHCSAIKILSQILKDYGPRSVLVSQGWLAMLLTEVQSSMKKSNDKGANQPKSDKVKTSINNSNIASAAQIANQLASAIVNLATKQLRITSNSEDAFPLADFLALEPFSRPFKNFKKGSQPKLDAADSALATMKAWILLAW